MENKYTKQWIKLRTRFACFNGSPECYGFISYTVFQPIKPLRAAVTLRYTSKVPEELRTDHRDTQEQNNLALRKFINQQLALSWSYLVALSNILAISHVDQTLLAYEKSWVDDVRIARLIDFSLKNISSSLFYN